MSEASSAFHDSHEHLFDSRVGLNARPMLVRAPYSKTTTDYKYMIFVMMLIFSPNYSFLAGTCVHTLHDVNVRPHASKLTSVVLHTNEISNTIPLCSNEKTYDINLAIILNP